MEPEKTAVVRHLLCIYFPEAVNTHATIEGLDAVFYVLARV
jgi:hypothetical protein